MALGIKDSRGAMPVRSGVTGSRSVQVLVVDDDSVSRRIVGRMVAALGWRADLADDALAAQALTRRSRYALVLTDLKMSGMNGHALAAWIKNRWMEIPVYIMTSCIPQDLECCVGSEVVDRWLRKPFDMDQLRRLLADLGLPGELKAAQYSLFPSSVRSAILPQIQNQGKR